MGLNRIVLSFFLFLTLPVCARAVVLFTPDGRHVENYDAIVRNLGPNDVITFGNGEQFTLGRRLGEGGTCVIYSIGNGRALRISRTRNSAVATIDGREVDAVTSFIEGYSPLRSGGVDVVADLPAAGLAPEDDHEIEGIV